MGRLLLRRPGGRFLGRLWRQVPRDGGFVEFFSVVCPFCLETVEIDVDPQTEGSFVQDCSVCCHPWQVHVVRDQDGAVDVRIESTD